MLETLLVSEPAFLHLAVVLGRAVNVELGETFLEPVFGLCAVLLLVGLDRKWNFGMRGNTKTVSL